MALKPYDKVLIEANLLSTKNSDGTYLVSLLYDSYNESEEK